MPRWSRPCVASGARPCMRKYWSSSTRPPASHCVARPRFQPTCRRWSTCCAGTPVNTPASGDPHPALMPAAWPAPAQVRGLVTLRHGAGGSAAPFDSFNLGTRCGDDPGVVAANRAELGRIAGLPSIPAWLRQVHGAGVVRIDRPPADGAGEPEADAAVTGTPGVVLAILTADCLPVLLCDRDGTRIGAAHAGWRGLAGGVLEATVAAMEAPPERLL